jgi:hypothetical protein
MLWWKSTQSIPKEDAVLLPPADDSHRANQNEEDPDAVLLVSGVLHLAHAPTRTVEVKRDMIILTSEGLAAGRVAAVLINRQDREVTHILLSRRSQPPQYRLVPSALILQVREGHVLLRIFTETIDSLPIWRK